MNVFFDICAAILALLSGVSFALSSPRAKLLKITSLLIFTTAIICNVANISLDLGGLSLENSITDWMGIIALSILPCLILALLGYLCIGFPKFWRSYISNNSEFSTLTKIMLATLIFASLATFAIFAIGLFLSSTGVTIAVLFGATFAALICLTLTLAFLVYECIYNVAKYLLKLHRKH